MNNREKFENKDRIIKGITADGQFKIYVVKTTTLVNTARERHGLSHLNTLLLGRLLTGTMLLAANLKGEERLQLRIEGGGPVGMMVAEATSNGEVRGYVPNPDVELDYTKQTDLGEAFGPALLNVSKVLYNEARPITGTVELVSGNINDDIAYYLLQSEQIASAISLDVGFDESGNVSNAGGIFIQALPGAEDENREQLEENLKNIPQVSELLNNGNYIDDIMKMAGASFEVRELDRYPVDFFCRCNKDRFRSALAMVSLDELKEMEETGQELVCHYCNEKYDISKAEITKIIKDAQVKLN